MKAQTTKSKALVKKTISKTSAYKAIKEDSTNIENLANDMCNCTKPFTDSLHPVIVTFQKDMNVMGEKKAQEKMNAAVQKLPQEDLEKIIKDGDKLEKIKDHDYGMGKCLEDLEKKHDKKLDKNPNSAKEKVYDKLLKYYFKKNSDCAILEMFI